MGYDLPSQPKKLVDQVTAPVADYIKSKSLDFVSGLAALYGTRMGAKQRVFLRSANALILGKN